MKALKLFFLLAIFMALVINIAFATHENDHDDNDVEEDVESLRSSGFTSFRGHFLAKKDPKDQLMTCNKFPGVCHFKGSQGPDCCKKKCVDVMKDNSNCGECGNKCKYSRICCQGGCMNPLIDSFHCGGCDKNCTNGCRYGMCDYA